jgi:hypothetical protein
MPRCNRAPPQSDRLGDHHQQDQDMTKHEQLAQQLGELQGRTTDNGKLR